MFLVENIVGVYSQNSFLFRSDRWSRLGWCHTIDIWGCCHWLLSIGSGGGGHSIVQNNKNPLPCDQVLETNTSNHVSEGDGSYMVTFSN